MINPICKAVSQQHTISSPPNANILRSPALPSQDREEPN